MGVKERKERERRQRSNEILESARRLFESKGFLNTTLQDVAENAEISVGLIYRYFQSKEDIFASLALKGAKQFDKHLGQCTRKAKQESLPVREVLQDIAAEFFDFYSVYGEYFDMLLYSYKGLKEVQIQAATLTRLMSVTLLSLNKLKNFMMSSKELDVRNEDDALRVVFVLWGILLGMHKLFDSSGRGHLVAFSREEFVRKTIDTIMVGIAAKEKKTVRARSKRSQTTRELNA
ncbi:MAG: TetR/AcrR family transcriptional regulator [Leptospiraceae bacterium]|nr:TetR/AcrR family transcriptional regulator [Leptospiraceae bacterium]